MSLNWIQLGLLIQAEGCICVSKLTIMGLDNGLLHGQHKPLS